MARDGRPAQRVWLRKEHALRFSPVYSRGNRGKDPISMQTRPSGVVPPPSDGTPAGDSGRRVNGTSAEEGIQTQPNPNPAHGSGLSHDRQDLPPDPSVAAARGDAGNPSVRIQPADEQGGLRPTLDDVIAGEKFITEVHGAG